MAATTQPSYWHFKIFLFRLPGRDEIKLCVDCLLQTIHITCRYLLSLYIYIIWASKNLDTPTFLTQTTEVSYGWHINDFFFFLDFFRLEINLFSFPRISCLSVELVNYLIDAVKGADNLCIWNSEWLLYMIGISTWLLFIDTV